MGYISYVQYTALFYAQDLSIDRLVSKTSPGSHPPEILRDDQLLTFLTFQCDQTEFKGKSIHDCFSIAFPRP